MEGAELTDDMLPERYEPPWHDLETASAESAFHKESFYLLREASTWLAIVASLTVNASSDRNLAIARGSLMRLTKLMRLMLRELTSEETFQQLAVARSVIETVATLTYLLEDDGSGE